MRLRSACAQRWLVEGAVSLTRATRSHPEVRMGSSVRGAIDLALIAERLAPLRGIGLGARDVRDASNAAKGVVLDAALLSLSGRMVLDETAQRPPEAIVRELWESVFYFVPQKARGERALDLENPISAPARRPRRRRRGPVVMPRRAQGQEVPRPKPGKVKEPPRVYRPNEMALLTAERAAGPAPPRSAEDIRRDNPAAREVLTEDEQFDREAFKELYERDEEAALSVLGDLWPNAADRELRELTRRMALRIVIRQARRNPTARAGRGKLRPARYRFDSDDLDLDRTLEEIAGKPSPEYDDFWVTERVRTRRAYALLLDVSGSMRGTKMMHAALAAASLARNIPDDDLCVVLF